MIEFEEGISNPESWFKQSWEMFEASKALYGILSTQSEIQCERENYRKVGAMKAAMLTLGLSAENALKGAFVYNTPPDTSNGNLSQKTFHETPHNLTEVAEKLNLPLTSEQKNVLERLTIFVQWASKYQTPLRKSEYERAMGNLKLVYPSDYNLTEALINSLQNQSGFSVKTGWPCKS